jgi:hypothetical protein
VVVGPNGQMILPPGVRLTPGDEDESGGRGTGQYL